MHNLKNVLNSKLKSYHLIIITGGSGICLTLLLGFILYMPMLKLVVEKQKALKPGNEMRDFYLKLPIPLDFRVHFFNISNPEEVLQGAKPVLHEVGPYCYDAYKEKVDVVDDKKADTLTYTPYDTYFFNQTRTGELSQDDYVTILNPITVGIINTVATQRPQYLKAVNKAIPIIFQENSNVYITARVRDILFDGINIDCNVRDFSASAMCSQLKGQPSLKEVGNSIFKFSLLGGRNGTGPTRITVKRGIKNGADIGKVVSINNQTNLTVWSSKECDEYRGTDGWIFPSFLKKENGIWTVATDLCRSFNAKYTEDFKYHSVSVRKYHADLGDMSSNPKEKCFCPTNDTCLPKGVMDLTKCMKAPLFCTLPHFLNADEKLLQQVDGLKPNKDKHTIVIYFEPITGTPMYGQRRIQFNLMLSPLEKITMMQKVPHVLHPILWIEEGVELEGFLLKKIRTVSALLKGATIFRYGSLLFCFQILAYGFYQYYKDWKASQVAPVEGTSAKSHKTDTRSGQETISVHSANNEIEHVIKNGVH